MQRKSKYLWAALAASLCLIVALLVMLGVSLRHQPLTGTYLCEGLSPGAGTYLVFDEKGGLHPVPAVWRAVRRDVCRGR